MADCSDIMTGGGTVDSVAKADIVNRRQKFDAKARAAKRLNGLLNSPEMAFQDSAQAKKFFDPIEAQRISVNQSQTGIETFDYIDSIPGFYFGKVDSVGASNVSVHNVQSIVW